MPNKILGGKVIHEGGGWPEGDGQTVKWQQSAGASTLLVEGVLAQGGLHPRVGVADA